MNAHLRPAGLGGTFYPESAGKLLELIMGFERTSDLPTDILLPSAKLEISGLIVPHAGWKYSGKTASLAYRLLRQDPPQNIALIGPSHYFPIEKVLRCDFEYFETPLGNIKAIRDDYFTIGDQIHEPEHSVEVQLPLIKHYFPHARVMMLLAGRMDEQQAEIIAQELLLKNYFIIISTDLSHFFTENQANEIDKQSIESIENLSLNGVDACGIYPLKIAMAYCRLKKTKPRLIDYSTSAEASGDPNRVVGYASFYF